MESKYASNSISPVESEVIPYVSKYSIDFRGVIPTMESASNLVSEIIRFAQGKGIELRRVSVENW